MTWKFFFFFGFQECPSVFIGSRCKVGIVVVTLWGPWFFDKGERWWERSPYPCPSPAPQALRAKWTPDLKAAVPSGHRVPQPAWSWESPGKWGAAGLQRALFRGLWPGPMAALSLSTLPSSKGHRCLRDLLVAAGRFTHFLLILCGMGHSRPCTPVTHMSSSQLCVSGFSGALANKVLGPIPSSPTAAQTD